MRSYWVYILASKPRGTLYIGVTNGIISRVEQHRCWQGVSYTRKVQGASARLVPGIRRNAREAIQREKNDEGVAARWKVNLVERENPHWIDLYPSLPGVRPP